MSSMVTVSPAALTQNPLPEEDQEERFIELSSNVAHSFVDLFLLKEIDGIIERSPETKTNKKSIVLKSEDEVLAESQDQAAFEVARRLKALGDMINEQMELTAEVNDALSRLQQNGSIWDFTYPKFQSLMQNVLGKCSDALKTGWEQVTVVYVTVASLVGELRVQQDERGGLRERQMKDFAGTYMRDSGLQEWIKDHGGLERISDASLVDGPQKVTILETDV